MDRVKYIILRSNGWEYGFTFPSQVMHSTFARVASSSLRQGLAQGSGWTTTVRAGFVELNRLTGELETTGSSESLNLSSHPDDIKILRAGRLPFTEADEEREVEAQFEAEMEQVKAKEERFSGARFEDIPSKGKSLRDRFKGRR